MAEYIEREKLFEAVKDKSITQFDWSEKVDLEEFEEVLANIPTADVVAVVRCKDCEFVKPTKVKLNGKDLRNCTLYKRPCFDNDFCSRGVLKECEGNE